MMNKKHKKAWQQIRKILEDDKRNVLPQLRRSCKECLHHTACKYWIDTFKKYIREDWEYVFVHTCFEYENKTKYVDVDSLIIPHYEKTGDNFIDGYHDGRVDAILDVRALASNVYKKRKMDGETEWT